MTLYQECRVCNTKKPLDHFHKDKHSFTGRRNKCKRCRHISEQLREGVKMLGRLDAISEIIGDSSISHRGKLMQIGRLLNAA